MSYKIKTSLKAIVGFLLLCAVAFIATWMGLSIAHKTNPIDEIKSWGQENEQIEEDKEPTEEDSELQNVEDIENYSDLTIVA